jgi:hypothetical protein
MTFSLSTIVVSDEGERLYTFESAASIAQTSVVVIQIYLQLGIIESIGSMLYSREIARIAQIQRLRQDLAQEVTQLRAQLEVYRSAPNRF